MKEELRQAIRELKKKQGDYSIDLSMTLEYVLGLIVLGVRDLVLCDAGRHSSCKVVQELIERYDVPAVALRGGLYVINDVLSVESHSLQNKTTTILKSFPHISSTRTISHCYDLYEYGTNFLVKKSRDFSGFEDSSKVTLSILTRSISPKK